MTQADDIVIDVNDIVTGFGSVVVHDHLNLQVRRGEILGIVGGSGTGKSVLLRHIIGLFTPWEGTITMLGQDVHALDEAQSRALNRQTGVLFQDGALFSSMTVAQNVMAPLREHLDINDDLALEIAAMKIAMSGLPMDSGAKYPSELSGGMRKRAGLARALALDPEILFLDEPTAGLDPISAAAFDSLIVELRDGLGLTVFMITHDVDTLRATCDRIAVLVDKRVIVDRLDGLLASDHPWIRDYFGGPRGRAAFAGIDHAASPSPAAQS